MTKRTFHPYVLVLFVVTWVVCLVVVKSLLLQLCLFVSVFIFMGRVRSARTQVWAILRFSIPFVTLYTAIAAMFALPGERILWQGPHIPALGTIAISIESVTRAAIQALRAWNLLLIIFSFGKFVRPEVIVELMGRRFSRVALTISMVISFIPNLLAERARILEVLRVRGGTVSGGKKSRIRTQIVVYQTLLMNALERSFQLAESMMLRGYGSPRRTFYFSSRWRRQDTVLLVALFLLIVVLTCVILFTTHFMWSCVATIGTCTTLFAIGGRDNVQN